MPPVHLVDDRSLLAEFVANGADDAFAEIVRRHNGVVRQACMRVLGNAADAEDVSQSVFVTLMKRAEGLLDCPSLGNWLYRAARNIARRSLDAEGSRKARERKVASAGEPRDVKDLEVEENQQAVLVEELYALPNPFKEALLLHHLENRSHRDAAAIMGCPVGTFSSWLSRGRAFLKDRVGTRNADAFATIQPFSPSEITWLPPLPDGIPPSQIDTMVKTLAFHDALKAIRGLGEPVEVMKVHAFLERLQYWHHQDHRASREFMEAGVAYGLEQARRLQPFCPNEAQQIMRSVWGLTYDIASFTWDGWGAPWASISADDLAVGLRSARRSVELAHQLRLPAYRRAMSHWVLGAHLLSAGDIRRAEEEMSRSLEADVEAKDRDSIQLAKGHLAVLGILEGSNATQNVLQLKDAKQSLEGSRYEDFFVDQLDSTLAYFAGRKRVEM